MAFERALGEKDVIEMLEQGKSQDAKVYAWYVLGDHVLWTDIKIQNIVKNKREIIFIVSESSAVFLTEIISGKGKINLYLESAKLIMSCALKEFSEEGKLVLTYPEYYFVEDRRRDGRAYIESPLKIKIQNKERILNRDCYDLGSGGLSFVLTNSETFSYKKEEKLKVEIDFKDEKVVLAAEVVNVEKIRPFKFENTPYGGKKISAKFVDLNPAHEKRIISFLNEFKSISKEK